jgi:hypothetical protein
MVFESECLFVGIVLCILVTNSTGIEIIEASLDGILQSLLLVNDCLLELLSVINASIAPVEFPGK